MVHATTLATNALIERKGARTGLLTTQGSESTLDIRKGLRYDQYDLSLQFPAPLVPRYLRRGVAERILWDGQVRGQLKARAVERALDVLVRDERIESLAVCLLHAYANPAHEALIRRIAARRFPRLPVSLSSELAPQIREYERMSTTVVDAYVKPLVQRYLRRLQSGLVRRGLRGPVLMMTCSAGVIPVDVAGAKPVLLLESGPAAGALMGERLARRTRLANVFAFDMGGTTAKGSLIVRGRAEKAYEFEAARIHRFKRGSGIPILVPTLRLLEIGGGGGSLAYVDARGVLQVGPESAGAEPGPACYGRGGTRPTVTDADLLLGYLAPDRFLGGTMSLFPERAHAVLAPLARTLRLDTQATAWSIHEKVNEDVATAFRMHAAERGLDHRQFTLVAFGGAGPVHAGRIARRLGIRRLVIPYRAGVWAAVGLCVSALAFEYVQSRTVDLASLAFDAYARSFEALSTAGRRLLRRARVPAANARIERRLDMRYRGQGFELELALPGARPRRAEHRALAATFNREYARVYGLSELSPSIELVNFKVSAAGPAPPFRVRAMPKAEGTSHRGSRPVFFAERGFIPCAVFDRYQMRAGERVRGPAVVEERESTCVVEPGVTARVDDLFNLVLEIPV